MITSDSASHPDAPDVSVVSPAELTSEQIGVWRQIQAANADQQTPYFHPEFVRLCAEHRRDVSVAVVSDSDGPFCYFPFHADGSVGGPIAGLLTDFQGLVIDADRAHRAGFTVGRLLEGAGLTRWHYDHLVASQHWFTDGRNAVVPSAAMDLSGGFDAYVEDRRQNGGSRFKDLGRRRRRMERELGEMRFDAHVDDEAVLAQVLTWKSEQFVRTGLADPFLTGWVTDLVTAVHGARADGFAGILSALYAGDRLVAAHLGMHSDRVWHYWFPTYDHEYNKYSPGLLLLMAMAEEAASRGMHTLDLGKGDDAYKSVFGNRSTDVAEGCAALPSLRWKVQKAAVRSTEKAKVVAKDAVGRTPLAGPLRAGLDKVRGRR